jgi:alginate O-acetyltransferase complex protein AlgI
MLFTSYEFIFFFLPLTTLAFFLVGRFNERAAAAWLALASLFFYGWWDYRFVILLLASICINYSIGITIARTQTRQRLAVGIIFNLALLCYFKYANFFIASFHRAVGSDFAGWAIVLPLGISFFTFTQIAFLVDTYQGKAREYSFVHYLLFVTYFPHLIAGPVLHHRQMMPQFAKAEIYRPRLESIVLGLAFFCVGLFKKIILADGIQPFVGPVFEAPAGQALSLPQAWGGALAYTLQLYFDFSGYSDMAIGLSRIFGVDLPLNFNSPYKANNIIDFWRRWHMTLSTFLRDYLYIPLGGNRKGVGRRHVNLLTTMVLGGLWHGAGWTFVIWGTLHGFYLVINYAWQYLSGRFHIPFKKGTIATKLVARVVTLAAVVVAWVFFRASSLDSALRIVHCMFDVQSWMAQDLGMRASTASPGLSVLPWIVVLGGIALFGPNSQSLLSEGRLARISGVVGRSQSRHIQLGTILGSILCVASILAVINGSRAISEFIYFNF